MEYILIDGLKGGYILFSDKPILGRPTVSQGKWSTYGGLFDIFLNLLEDMSQVTSSCRSTTKKCWFPRHMSKHFTQNSFKMDQFHHVDNIWKIMENHLYPSDPFFSSSWTKLIILGYLVHPPSDSFTSLWKRWCASMITMKNCYSVFHSTLLIIPRGYPSRWSNINMAGNSTLKPLHLVRNLPTAMFGSQRVSIPVMFLVLTHHLDTRHGTWRSFLLLFVLPFMDRILQCWETHHSSHIGIDRNRPKNCLCFKMPRVIIISYHIHMGCALKILFVMQADVDCPVHHSLNLSARFWQLSKTASCTTSGHFAENKGVQLKKSSATQALLMPLGRCQAVPAGIYPPQITMFMWENDDHPVEF